MIAVKTDDKRSIVVGRNGTHRLAEVRLWQGADGMLFIDGIGRRGHTLHAGFYIDPVAAIELLEKLKTGTVGGQPEYW